jgi:hypothetical protein
MEASIAQSSKVDDESNLQCEILLNFYNFIEFSYLEKIVGRIKFHIITVPVLCNDLMRYCFKMPAICCFILCSICTIVIVGVNI